MLVPDYSFIQICFLTTGLQSSTHLSETTHLTPPSAPGSFNQLLSFQTQETNKRNRRKIKTAGLLDFMERVGNSALVKMHWRNTVQRA